MIDQDVMQLMKKLDQLSQREQFALLSEVDGQRQELLGVLLKHFGSESSPQVRAAAAYLIGSHRLSDGVSALLEHIELEVATQMARGPLPLWEQYPAMEALIKIGKPSIRPALELLATQDNALRRDLAVKVLRYVEGFDVAEFMLQKSMQSEDDSARKAKLKDAIGRLSKLPR